MSQLRCSHKGVQKTTRSQVAFSRAKSTDFGFYLSAPFVGAAPFHGFLGGLLMWLQLMWLQFEVVRGHVGVVWGQFGAGLGPCGPQINPKRPRPDLGQPQIAATSVAATSIDGPFGPRQMRGYVLFNLVKLLLKISEVHISYRFLFSRLAWFWVGRKS